MLAIKHLVVFFLATFTTSASILASRDLNTALQDFIRVDGDVKNSTACTNTFDGQSIKFIYFINNTTKLISDIQKAGNDTAASQPGASGPCSNLLNYIDRQLEPDVKSFVNAVIVKRQIIINAGLKATFRQRLQQIQTALVNALNAICQKCSASTCPGSVTTARNDLQKAIDQFA